MNQEIKFYDFNKNIYLTTIYINNSSIKDYTEFFKTHNININTVSFMDNFKILNIIDSIKNINNIIIIIPKTLININSVPSTTLTNSILSENKNINNKMDIDDETSKYLNLLQKYPDLISFIIILKTDMIEYITLYLKKYRKKNIYNIIRNNQKEIIEMLEKNGNFINFYIRTCNVNILQNILNYSSTNIIISQIEEIFPDVPSDNIEELIDIFSN